MGDLALAQAGQDRVLDVLNPRKRVRPKVAGLTARRTRSLSVLVYTAAPFTLAGSYRSEALSIATALVSGVVVARSLFGR